LRTKVFDCFVCFHATYYACKHSLASINIFNAYLILDTSKLSGGFRK
jgi:hypothetical protein